MREGYRLYRTLIVVSGRICVWIHRGPICHNTRATCVALNSICFGLYLQDVLTISLPEISAVSSYSTYCNIDIKSLCFLHVLLTYVPTLTELQRVKLLVDKNWKYILYWLVSDYAISDYAMLHCTSLYWILYLMFFEGLLSLCYFSQAQTELSHDQLLQEVRFVVASLDTNTVL